MLRANACLGAIRAMTSIVFQISLIREMGFWFCVPLSNDARLANEE